MIVFSDPAIQQVWDSFDNAPSIGDYQKGCRAYIFGKPRVYIPEPTGDADADNKNYTSRVECWMKGYDEGAQDHRYKVLHELALKFRAG